MRGVLVLAHGSKRRETEDTLNAVVSMLREELREAGEAAEVEGGFLQFSERDLHAGLNALADKGADEILVAPYFLFAGNHIKEDIPAEIEEFAKARPGVRVRLGGTLGADRRLARILRDRVLEAAE